MTDLRQAAQQALDALELYQSEMSVRLFDSAVASLRAALAEDAMQRLTDEQQMIERGTKAWADVPDATAWVQEMRGNVPAPTSQESRQVEPVAYVAGYSKGYATVRPIDPCLLMCVGMELYRSPPTINEMETVEPVAWMYQDQMGYWVTAYGKQKSIVARPVTPLYTAPPKREPLTDEEIHDCFQQKNRDKATERRMIARAIERVHGIGGEE